MNLMKSKRCFNPHHRWQSYRTSWPLKDATGNSFHHTDHNSEDYRKQQWNPWSTICDEYLVLMLTHTRNCAHYLLREAYLNSRSLCALPDDPFNLTYLSPGHFLIGEPFTQLPDADFTDHLTTSRACNSTKADRGHHLTYNKAISSWWGRTTRYPYIGPQVSSRKRIQAKMASFTCSHFVPREIFKRPVTKICPLSRVNDE